MTRPCIGIRLEDKSRWERRAPLSPANVRQLVEQNGIDVILQPSPVRVFPETEYEAAGATVSMDLAPASVVFAVKEIPANVFEPNKTYVFFSHTIKGQSYNMPMLQKMLDLGCTLIDYERVMDAHNRRLIFFGWHAGVAGMIDTLWALGQRLLKLGYDTPFASIKQAYQYASLPEAKQAVQAAGEEIAAQGLPSALTPMTFGFGGYGNVSRGAQEIFDLLPHAVVSPQELAARATAPDAGKALLKIVFKEEHMAEPIKPGASFDLQDYFQHPAKYRGRFERYVPYLSVFVNCIYWTEAYPRLITREQVAQLYKQSDLPRLQVIGDISCDIDGSVEITVKATQPDAPVYVYEPATGEIRYGVDGRGPVVMAVDNLPCELPREATEDFGKVLVNFIPAIVAADATVPFSEYAVPPEIKRAVIAYQGKLAPDYRYIQKYLQK